MFADPRLEDAFARLPDYLGSHIRVSATALALGLAISLPLAILARERPTLRGALLGIASVTQTIPGLALLALFYPVLLALSAVTSRWLDVSFSAFGFLPAVLALALYSMLPAMRNTITGLNGIDPALREAADGVGMTARQKLWIVELPLALPVMMAGIRTAAVWVIGTATLATPIGQTSLGNYIFAGLQTQNWILVIVGCLAAAVLALIVDQLLALLETGLARRSRMRFVAGISGLTLLIAPALAGLASGGGARIVVGAKTFTEQYVLSQLIVQRLRAQGLNATTREGLGSSVIFTALTRGEIALYVDYSGTLWANQFKHTDLPPRDDLRIRLDADLTRAGVVAIGDLGFENAYALVMPRRVAERLNVRSVADLATHTPQLTIAGDYEFFSRPEWTALRDAYGLNFRAQRTMQPDFMYAAVASGEVDVIAGYTSDGLIAKYDLVVLDDPKKAIPPYDAILLATPAFAKNVAARAAMAPLLGTIDLAAMREANLRAAENSVPAAVTWLADTLGLGQGR